MGNVPSFSKNGRIFNTLGNLRLHLNHAGNFYTRNILNYEIVSFEAIEQFSHDLSTEVELSIMKRQERDKSTQN